MTAIYWMVTLTSALIVQAGTYLISRLRRKFFLISALVVILVYGGLFLLGPRHWLITNWAVLAAAVAVGSAIGRLLKSPPSLYSFGLAASVADVLSYTRGVTFWLLSDPRQEANPLLSLLTISLPAQDSLQPVVGIGDLIILAALTFAFLRMGYRSPGLILAPLAGLMAALLIGLRIGGIFAIPFIVGAALIALRVRQQRGSATEAQRTQRTDGFP